MFRYNEYMAPKDKVEVLKALADETRLAIVSAVAAKPGCTAGCDIVGSCPGLAGMSQPTLSHHFARLVSAGVLREQKTGTSKSYFLREDILHDAGVMTTVLLAK